MEKSVLTMPGYRINEYQLVLRLPPTLWHKVQKVKDEFADSFQVAHARWGKPHITLARFVQYEMMETRIVNRINCITMAQYPFNLQLQDYGCFPTHTLYIRMATKHPVLQLVKQLRSDLQRLVKHNEQHNPYFSSEPIITVAANLQPLQFNLAWEVYSRKHFTAQFLADSLLLLKRPVSEQPFQIVQRFAFQNLPVATKQLALFA